MSELEGAKISGPLFWDLVVRLGNAGPQWRPTADAIEAELTAYMKNLYPAAPSNVAANYARGMVTKALQVAAKARAASGDGGADE